MDDDFGFDSADEADLLAVADGVPPSTKRAPDDGDDAIEEPASKKHRSGSQISELAQKVLRERFGLNAFRLEQEAAISRIIGGESAVVVFPTGGGKSLCYQVRISTASSTCPSFLMITRSQLSLSKSLAVRQIPEAPRRVELLWSSLL